MPLLNTMTGSHPSDRGLLGVEWRDTGFIAVDAGPLHFINKPLTDLKASGETDRLFNQWIVG
jgi:hypothetical protein